MRHTPTTIYIDTEYFKRNGLKLDTIGFQKVKENFKPKGLRLLIPKMMEKELLRHYEKQSKECANYVDKAYNMHPVQQVSIFNEFRKDEIERICLEKLIANWLEFKEFFTIVELPLISNIDEIVDWYFSQKAPFSETKKKEFPDAFILNVLDQYHRDNGSRIAIISNDGDFINAGILRRHVMRFSSIDEYVDKLLEQINKIAPDEPEPLDVMKPIVTEDITEIKTIASYGERATSIEIERLIKILHERGEGYKYFLLNEKNPFWLNYLVANGFFDNIPEGEKNSSGGIRYTNWPPIHYLENISDLAKSEVFDVLLRLPVTSNPFVLDILIALIIKIDAQNSLRLFINQIKSFVNKSTWNYESIISLLNWPQFFSSSNIDLSLSIILDLIKFSASDNNPRNVNSRFNNWTYHQILNRGVIPLADKEPYQIARILIDAASSMIRLKLSKDELDGRDNDEN